MKRTDEEKRAIKVRFAFRKINYYRITRETGERIGEVRGETTLKLFESWFKLMEHTGRLLYGVLEYIETGDMWIWQPKVENPQRPWARGGWQKALDGEETRRKRLAREALKSAKRIFEPTLFDGNATAPKV